MTRDNVMSFRLVDANGGDDGLPSFSAGEGHDLEVGVDETTRLALGKEDAESGGFTWRAMRGLEFRDGMLKSAGFVDHQILLRRPSPANGAPGSAGKGETALFGARQYFSFTLEVPADTVFDAGLHLAEFVSKTLTC